jgi:hypothetical protein
MGLIMKKIIYLFIVLIIPALLFNSCESNPANSEGNMSYLSSLEKGKSKMTIKLTEDLVVTETFLIPDGYTLDGRGHTITAMDPPGGHFKGAVVKNEGAEAHVKNLTVTVSGLANVCDGGDDRLRGIMFEGASGSITHCTVTGINQGPSGCQEGNAIEVRNAPFDGTHPATVKVKIEHNKIYDYQKTGIVCNGDVDAKVKKNTIGASATQENLAANSVQFGYGATGSVEDNKIDGNQWMGTSDWAATAVLIYLADGVKVKKNKIKGNSDIGVYFYGNDGKVEKNKIEDEGPDHPNSGYDIGLGNWGENNKISKNKIKGFDTPIDALVAGYEKMAKTVNSTASAGVDPFE